MNAMTYSPPNLGRWIIWGATGLLMLVLPLFFTKGFSITLLSQMGIGIIFALSYNMLLGQAGMLSFGHAVYSGLGAYFAIHALAVMGKGGWPIAVTWLPLIGGLAGAFFGCVFGYVSTKRAGTTFAMISMGLGELVFNCSLMFPGFFGGEGGINANRVVGTPFLGIDYKSGTQVYYLVAVWTFVCMAAMYAFTHTPLGRMSNAVRDNPERAEFVGYDTQKVRWIVMIVASFFAGVAGGLSAVMFEIVTAENVSAVRSGGVLLATFIGGVTFFFGPILGACLFAFFVIALSEFTKAWLLYLGFFFVIMVMVAPGGLASLIMMQFPVARVGRLKEMMLPYAKCLGAMLLMLAGAIVLIETGYYASLELVNGPTTKLWGITYDVTGAAPWLIGIGLLAGGTWVFRLVGAQLSAKWSAVQDEIARRAGLTA